MDVMVLTCVIQGYDSRQIAGVYTNKEKLNEGIERLCKKFGRRFYSYRVEIYTLNELDEDGARIESCEFMPRSRK